MRITRLETKTKHNNQNLNHNCHAATKTTTLRKLSRTMVAVTNRHSQGVQYIQCFG